MNMTTKKANKKTQTVAKKATAKSTSTAKSTAETQEKKLSGLDAAARVLKEKGVAMTCQEMIGEMAAKGYWSSPNGKTPAATLSSAILREITTKGDAARFMKAAPGRFATRDSTEPTQEPSATEAKKSRKKNKPASKPAEPTIPDGTPGPESIAELFRI
jgi:hypothetical protein